MKRVLLTVSAILLLCAVRAFAQEPGTLRVLELREPTLEDPSMTPELYLQLKMLREAKGPKAAVRAKAAEQARRRRERIAARRWYGLSNARPVVSPVPWFGVYSPRWVGGGQHPYNWSGGQYGVIVVDRSAPSEVTPPTNE